MYYLFGVFGGELSQAPALRRPGGRVHHPGRGAAALRLHQHEHGESWGLGGLPRQGRAFYRANHYVPRFEMRPGLGVMVIGSDDSPHCDWQ